MNAQTFPPMAHRIKKPRGEWIPAVSTDIAATFKRIKAEQEQAAKTNVRQIKARK